MTGLASTTFTPPLLRFVSTSAALARSISVICFSPFAVQWMNSSPLCALSLSHFARDTPARLGALSHLYRLFPALDGRLSLGQFVCQADAGYSKPTPPDAPRTGARIRWKTRSRSRYVESERAVFYASFPYLIDMRCPV